MMLQLLSALQDASSQGRVSCRGGYEVVLTYTWLQVLVQYVYEEVSWDCIDRVDAQSEAN